MKPELFNELRKIRNEISHGASASDASYLERRLSELGVSIPAGELRDLLPKFLKAFGEYPGMYHIPQQLLQVLRRLLQGRQADVVCDPWARFGAIIDTACEVTKAKKTLAFTPSEEEATLGKILVQAAEWRVGPPLDLLDSLTSQLDVCASILPVGLKSDRSLTFTASNESSIEWRDDLGNLILTSATMRLSAGGIGLFVVAESFFFAEHSVLRHFKALGIGIEAALALPSGAFAPYTNIATYLLVVRKSVASRMFVAQLSSDPNTNLQIISNLEQSTEGGTLELGRFVDPLSFVGLDLLQMVERFQQARDRFGVPATPLEKLATAINLGRSSQGFEFPKRDNAIFIPLIGVSDVVDSMDELRLKSQNYAQVVIDPERSNARFVARFFNSEIGKEIRELNKTAGVIPKLNKQKLQKLQVFVPDLQTQRGMIEIETRITAEQNTLLGLQNEIAELRRTLWSEPKSAASVNRRLIALSSRLSVSLKEHTVERLDRWFETLPFPLATILRAWQATPSQDFKTKHEHLLHFFEATAEFISIILLSAFSSNEALFEPHKQKLREAMQKQNLSFQQATFGTWKMVVEYLGKQIRQLLSDGGKRPDDAKNDRAICANIFSDSSLVLPDALSRKELGSILSTTNKMRNDWSGHGGVVGQDEAQLRNEQLIAELEKLRDAMADMWADTELIHALHCRPRKGVFENEVAILMGSNSEFLKENRSMSTWLDVEQLYVSRKEEGGSALRLLPLVTVGPSPQSAKNACYFFNRLERDGARFVSYHFADKPELKEEFKEAIEAIRLMEA
jgi:hypothetical protein